VKPENESDEWKAKARRAEEQAERAGDKRTADNWREIARIYWDIAARREAWEKAWMPRPLGLRKDKGEDSQSD
jgi:hypothetical protein